MRTEIPARLVIGRAALGSSRQRQRHMPHRAGPGSIRILLHHRRHELTLRRELRRRTRGLLKLMPVVQPGTEREQRGQGHDDPTAGTDGPQGGNGEEKRKKVQTVDEGFFSIEEVQQSLKPQQAGQDEAEPKMVIEGDQPPQSIQQQRRPESDGQQPQWTSRSRAGKLKGQTFGQAKRIGLGLGVRIVFHEPDIRGKHRVEDQGRQDVGGTPGLGMIDELRLFAMADKKFGRGKDELLHAPEQNHHTQRIDGELHRLLPGPSNQRYQQTRHPVRHGKAERQCTRDHIGRSSERPLLGEQQQHEGQHDRERSPGIGVGHRKPEQGRGATQAEQREDRGIQSATTKQAEQQVQRPGPQAAHHAGDEQHRAKRAGGQRMLRNIDRDEGEQRKQRMHGRSIVVVVHPAHIRDFA